MGPGRASGGPAASPRRCPGHVSSERRTCLEAAVPGLDRDAQRTRRGSSCESPRRPAFAPPAFAFHSRLSLRTGRSGVFPANPLSPDTRNRLRVAVTNGFQRQRSCLLGRLSGPDAHTVFLCQTPPCLYAQLLFPQQWHEHVSCTFARDFTIRRIFSPSIRKHSAENSPFMVSHQKGKKIGRI